MTDICIYTGSVPYDLFMCNRCKLFLETCVPIGSPDGFAIGSECGSYLCESCIQECSYQECLNL